MDKTVTGEDMQKRSNESTANTVKVYKVLPFFPSRGTKYVTEMVIFTLCGCVLRRPFSPLIGDLNRDHHQCNEPRQAVLGCCPQPLLAQLSEVTDC